MANLANYSPYNKTYKFIMFQNQAYHQKNKHSAKPCVRSNLRYAKTNNHSFYNPEFSQSELLDSSIGRRDKAGLSPNNSVARSMVRSSWSLRDSHPQIKESKRVVHKNESFEKFQNYRVSKDNQKLVNRLISTSCQVIPNKKSHKFFEKHLKYREIRNKYSPEGKRKDALIMGNQDLLCPTLRSYNESGMAASFIEDHMSWRKTPSTRNSLRRRRSNLSQL